MPKKEHVFVEEKIKNPLSDSMSADVVKIVDKHIGLKFNSR